MSLIKYVSPFTPRSYMLHVSCAGAIVNLLSPYCTIWMAWFIFARITPRPKGEDAVKPVQPPVVPSSKPHTRFRFVATGVLIAALLAVSGCSGNCQAAGSKGGGSFLCNALKF